MLPDPETCRRLARDVAPRWIWLRGMSVITTRTAGLPRVEAGTSLVINSEADIAEMVVEGYFGPIPPDVSHHHPDVERLWAERDEALERARANALPDLTDPLTAAGALLVFRAVYADSTAFASRGHAEALGDARDWVAWARLDPDEPDAYDGVGFGPTELEALIAAILAAPEKP